MDVNAILSMWQLDSQINKQKIGDESVKRPQLHHKYLTFLTACKREMNRLNREMAAFKLKKTQWYHGKLTKDELDTLGWAYGPFGNNSKPMKSEMDDYIKCDPDVVAKQVEIDEMKLCYDALVEIVNSVNWRNKDLQVALDWAKFESGN